MQLFRRSHAAADGSATGANNVTHDEEDGIVVATTTDAPATVDATDPKMIPSDDSAANNMDPHDDSTSTKRGSSARDWFQWFIMKPLRAIFRSAELLIWSILFIFVIFVVVSHRRPPTQPAWNKLPIHKGVDHETDVRRKALGLSPLFPHGGGGGGGGGGGDFEETHQPHNDLDYHDNGDFLDTSDMNQRRKHSDGGGGGGGDGEYGVDMNHVPKEDWQQQQQQPSRDTYNDDGTMSQQGAGGQYDGGGGYYGNDNGNRDYNTMPPRDGTTGDAYGNDYYGGGDGPAQHNNPDEDEERWFREHLPDQQQRQQQRQPAYRNRYYEQPVKAPPLSVEDIQKQIRRLEMNEQFAMVKLRLRELEELKKQRQRLTDEYDFGDEQDAFRDKEREWQRLKWAAQEKKFRRWMRHADVDDALDNDNGRGLPSPPSSRRQNARDDNDDCPGMHPIHPFVPYAQHVQNLPDNSYAYVTYVSSAEFVPAAATLLHSIAVSGSQYARAVVITSDISQRDRDTLSLLGQLILIDKIMSPRYIDNQRYRETFTKLRVWQLAMYKRILYIDTDVVVTRNMDDLFDISEWAVPMDAEQNRYSTGMMVCNPSLQTFDQMLEDLKTTTTSMELPDLLFLKAYFDNPAHNAKINIIPRWYQVYQEEFGSQYSTYLTNRKQKLTIFDSRIHGIHYPGAGKPWGNYGTKMAKYKPHFCHWQDADIFQYEPQFLWYVHHELMLRSLQSSKSSSLFDFEGGGGLITLSQWVEEKKKKDEEEKNAWNYNSRWGNNYNSYNSYNNYGNNYGNNNYGNNKGNPSYNSKYGSTPDKQQPSSGDHKGTTPEGGGQSTNPNDFTWVYADGKWEKKYTGGAAAADNKKSGGTGKPPGYVVQDATQVWALPNAGGCRFAVTTDFPRTLMLESTWVQSMSSIKSTASSPSGITAVDGASNTTQNNAEVVSARKAKNHEGDSDSGESDVTTAPSKKKRPSDKDGFAPSSTSIGSSDDSAADALLAKELLGGVGEGSSSSGGSGASSSTTGSGADGFEPAQFPLEQQQDVLQTDTPTTEGTAAAHAMGDVVLEEEGDGVTSKPTNRVRATKRNQPTRVSEADEDPLPSSDVRGTEAKPLGEEDSSNNELDAPTASTRVQKRRATPRDADTDTGVVDQPLHREELGKKRSPYATQEGSPLPLKRSVHNVRDNTGQRQDDDIGTTHNDDEGADQIQKPVAALDNSDGSSSTVSDASAAHSEDSAGLREAEDAMRKAIEGDVRSQLKRSDGFEHEAAIHTGHNPYHAQRRLMEVGGQQQQRRQRPTTLADEISDDADDTLSRPPPTARPRVVKAQPHEQERQEGGASTSYDKSDREPHDDTHVLNAATAKPEQQRQQSPRQASRFHLIPEGVNRGRTANVDSEQTPRESYYKKIDDKVAAATPKKEAIDDDRRVRPRQVVVSAKRDATTNAETTLRTFKGDDRRQQQRSNVQKPQRSTDTDDVHVATTEQQTKMSSRRTAVPLPPVGLSTGNKQQRNINDKNFNPRPLQKQQKEEKVEVQDGDDLNLLPRTTNAVYQAPQENIDDRSGTTTTTWPKHPKRTFASQTTTTRHPTSTAKRFPAQPTTTAMSSVGPHRRQGTQVTPSDAGNDGGLFDEPVATTTRAPHPIDNKGYVGTNQKDQGESVVDDDATVPPITTDVTINTDGSSGSASTGSSGNGSGDVDAKFMKLLNALLDEEKKRSSIGTSTNDEGTGTEKKSLLDVHAKQQSQSQQQPTTPVPTPPQSSATPTAPQVIPGATIDFSLTPPLIVSLPQEWAPSPTNDAYQWVLSWCSPTKLRPIGSTRCGKAAHVSQYSDGVCRTNFDESFEVLPIYARAGDVAPPMPTHATHQTTTTGGKAQQRAESPYVEPFIHDDSTDDVKGTYNKSAIVGIAGVVFRSKVTLDTPLRAKWFEAVVRCDPSMAPNLVDLDQDSAAPRSQSSETTIPPTTTTEAPSFFGKRRYGATTLPAVGDDAPDEKQQKKQGVVVVVKNAHPPHDRAYRLRLRSRCACLGGCDSTVNSTHLRIFFNVTKNTSSTAKTNVAAMVKQSTPTTPPTTTKRPALYDDNLDYGLTDEDYGYGTTTTTTKAPTPTLGPKSTVNLNNMSKVDTLAMLSPAQQRFVLRQFNTWKAALLKPYGGLTSKERCETYGADVEACIASSTPRCEFDVLTNRCSASTTPGWLQLYKVEERQYCNCSHVGGDAEKSRTLQMCQAEAEAAGANVVNFVGSTNAKQSSSGASLTTSAPPLVSGRMRPRDDYVRHNDQPQPQPKASKTSFGCFYKKCDMAMWLSGRISVAKYVPGGTTDGLTGFDVYYLNAFAQETSAPTTGTPIPTQAPKRQQESYEDDDANLLQQQSVAAKPDDTDAELAALLRDDAYVAPVTKKATTAAVRPIKRRSGFDDDVSDSAIDS